MKIPDRYGIRHNVPIDFLYCDCAYLQMIITTVASGSNVCYHMNINLHFRSQ